MPNIFYSSRVLVKLHTREIACAHRLLEIRGNIGPILFVLYSADAENRLIDLCMAFSTTVTQMIHSITSSFQSGWRPTDLSSIHPSLLEFLWCTTLRRRRLLDYSTFALGDTEVRQADITATLESTLTAVLL